MSATGARCIIESYPQPNRPTLILTVGLPRSGKSTWARSQGFPIVCPDEIRKALHGQRFAKEAEPFVWAIAKVMVTALFASGHRAVIVDATHIKKAWRDTWKDPRWINKFEVICVDQEEAVRRAKVLGDLEIIPIIEKMAAEFEPVTTEEFE